MDGISWQNNVPDQVPSDHHQFSNLKKHLHVQRFSTYMSWSTWLKWRMVVMPLDKVCDLRVILDSKLKMHDRVPNITHSSYYQSRQLRRSTRDTHLSLHSLSVGLTTAMLWCTESLQMVMSAAACLVIGAGKFTPIMLTLRDVEIEIQPCRSYELPTQ